MGYHRSRKLLRLTLFTALALGGLVVLFSFVWVPVYQASSVDVILTPDERSDRKLIEVVNRTHRYNATRHSILVGPYRVLGALTIASALVGLIALRDVPRPLVPGIIGMQDRKAP